jgi:thiol:disulfide interchange protein DsbC
MMEWKKTGLLLAAALASSQLLAETPDEARIRKMVEPRMGANVKVDEVKKTPYADLYEVRTNDKIFYTDETARYMFVGKVVDLTTLKDVTRQRIDDIGAVRSFSDLPLDLAIKTVKGNGKRVMAVFEDPNCPYCKQLHAALKGVDNVTVYTFLLNIVSEDSPVKARNIWCSVDRTRAWAAWMDEGKPAPAAPASCATPGDQVLALSKKLHVTGTPTVYFADGTRTVTIDAATIEARLNAAKPKA